MINSTKQIVLEDNLTNEELLNLVIEQRKTIKSLQDKDEKNNNLFENSIDGFYRSSFEGKFIDVNSSLVTMLGYHSKEELLNIDIKSQLYFNDLDRETVLQQSENESRKINSIRRKDGSELWVEDYVKKITDSNGKLLYYEGIVRDVSQVKKAKKIQKVLLKISQEGYKTESLRDLNKFIMLELGKLIDTTNFYIAFYNEEKQTISIPFITGEDAEENFPVGKSMTGYLIKKNAPLLIKSNEYKQLIASGEIQLIGTFPKAWLGVPLAENNKVIGAIVVQSYNDKNAFKQDDIELLEFISSQIGFMLQRRKVSQENLISKEVLRKVLDNIPTKVFWKDKNSKFLGLNATSLKELNVDHESMVIGKTDFDLHHIKDAEKYRADELAVMKSGEPKLNYIESQIRNGKEHSYISSKLPFFDANNKVIGIIGTSEDITERIENEDKLKKATEEAIAANLSKSTFLSNMSHEIRTPMNAILGYSQLLQDDSNLTKAQQESLRTINKSGEHLLDLINDILDMSKIEAGRITLKPVNFDFIELLKEVELLFKMKAKQKNLELAFQLTMGVSKNIFADESRVKQVIINLLGNALKFTTNGFVHVLIENIDNETMKVCVKDSGSGILKEEHEVIFKPFEQSQKGGQVREGTGLGLAISKKFANLMGGDITIESEYQKGSEFSFTFKFQEGEDYEAVEEKKEFKVLSLAPEMKGLKVAIVDDRFENRDILYKKLSPLGFETRIAENGLEAVELYKNWKPDIILMDVVMPVMDGVEATRQILNLANGHDVKIFVVSASALESEQKEIMEIGATVFIKKPVIFDSLLYEMQTKGNVQFLFKENYLVENNEKEAALASEVPQHLKAKFIKASEEGDFTLLQELLEELESDSNKSFKYIEECINEMEFENLMNWLKS
jgi:PAS domain S-box-containing protein